MAKSAASGQCGFCPHKGTLAQSHAIPQAAFREMLTRGSGKVISIPDADGIAEYTSDTGAAPLLCEKCEREFNRRFDSPLSNALKKLAAMQDDQSMAAKVRYDTDELAQAVVSIGWRIAVSSADMYRGANGPTNFIKELECILRLPASNALERCSVQVSRLRDARSESDGGFGPTGLRQLVKSPQIYRLSSKRKSHQIAFAMDWTMFGYLIVLTIPRLGYAKRKQLRTIKGRQESFRTSSIDFKDYKPLMDSLVAGYAAQHEGRLSKRLSDRSK